MIKNYFFVLVLAALAFTSLICVTCSRLEDNSPEINQEFDNPFDFIGYYHNNGLDFILQNFLRSGLNNKVLQDTISEVYSLLSEFVSTIPSGSMLNNDLINRNLKAYYDKIMNQIQAKYFWKSQQWKKKYGNRHSRKMINLYY